MDGDGGRAGSGGEAPNLFFVWGIFCGGKSMVRARRVEAR